MREKQNLSYIGKNNSHDSEFLIRNYEGQKEIEKHFSRVEKKTINPNSIDSKFIFQEQRGNKDILK